MNKLKTFGLLLILLFAFNTSFGTHISGATISYRYIGDSTLIANHYLVDVYLIGDVSGQPISSLNAFSIEVCSSCHATSNFAVYRTSTLPVTSYFDLFDCGAISGNIPGRVVYKYQGDVVLPGTCSDFLLSVVFAARSYADNLYGTTLKATAQLNNALGQNSSPIISPNIFRTLCVQKQNFIFFTATNPDADSVAYRLVEVKEFGTTSCTSDSIFYNPGFSAEQPFAVDSLNPAIFNSNIGILTVVPINQGVYQMGIEIVDYRFDTLYSLWNKVGSSFCDIPIIVAVCNADSINNVKVDTSGPTIYFDNLTNEWYYKGQCGDTSLTLNYTNEIFGHTIESTGSDFWMLDPNKNPFPIIGAACVNATTSKDVRLDFAFPFSINGRYVLRYKTGNDNNTISSVCGGFAEVGDSIIVNVTGCSGVGLVENNTNDLFKVYPNPTKDFVNFSFDEKNLNLDYVLYNLQGQTILKGIGQKCDLEQLPIGVYVLVCKYKGNEYIERILKF